LGLKQDESALNDLNKAVVLDPHYPTAYFSRSEVLERMGEKEQADLDRETAERLQKQISQAYLVSQGIEFQEM
jgi:Tfp pilus assembly protein PilF